MSSIYRIYVYTTFRNCSMSTITCDANPRSDLKSLTLLGVGDSCTAATLAGLAVITQHSLDISLEV